MFLNTSHDFSPQHFATDVTRIVFDSMDLKKSRKPISRAVQSSFDATIQHKRFNHDPLAEKTSNDLSVIPLELNFNLHNRPKTPKLDYYESVNKQLRQKYKKIVAREVAYTNGSHIETIEKTMGTQTNWDKQVFTSGESFFKIVSHPTEVGIEPETQASIDRAFQPSPFVTASRPQTRYVKQPLRSTSKHFKKESPMFLQKNTDVLDTNSPTPNRFKTVSPKRTNKALNFFGFVANTLEQDPRLNVNKPEFEIVDTGYGLRKVLKVIAQQPNDPKGKQAKPYLNLNKVNLTECMPGMTHHRRRLNQTQVIKAIHKGGSTKKVLPIPEPGINTYTPFPGSFGINSLVSPLAQTRYKATGPLTKYKKELKENGNLFAVLSVLEGQHLYQPHSNIRK